MKNQGILIFIIYLTGAILSCQKPIQKIDNKSVSTINIPVIAIHGGAGVIKKNNYTDAQIAAYEKSLNTAVDSGYAMLKRGLSAIKVVEMVVNILEDDSLFNAGRGAVLTNDGKAELDAAIMDGKTLKAGAVASLSQIKNPVSLASAVMNKSEHVFMIGSGAEKFATEQGFNFVPNEYFVTHRMKTRYKKTQSPNGTVGCVALDKDGNLAAATSTGGMWGKRYGRVGDVPVIGAGTYANNSSCAISCTGWGEFFIKQVAAFQVHARYLWNKEPLNMAVENTLKEIEHLGGNGGLISIDKQGNIYLGFNTPGMFRASINKNGYKTVKIFKD